MIIKWDQIQVCEPWSFYSLGMQGFLSPSQVAQKGRAKRGALKLKLLPSLVLSLMLRLRM